MGWLSILTALLFIFSGSNVLAVDIFYSGCTNGHLENCHCPKDPLGALEKRLPEVERHRQLGDILLLDSGDFCPALVDSLGARFIVEAFELFKYDAVGLGDQEILQGETILEKILEKLPVVSANLSYRNGKLIAPQFRVFRKGKQTFAVTSILHPSAFHFIEPSLVNYVSVLDPDSCLNVVKSEIPAGSKLILLSHSGYDIDKKIVSKWKDVDLIIGGHDQSVINGVDLDNGSPIVQAGGNSRYQGVARIRGSRVKAELIPIKPELPDDERMIDLIIRHKTAKMRLKLNSN